MVGRNALLVERVETVDVVLFLAIVAPQRLKQVADLLHLRRGLKARPFKAKSKSEFSRNAVEAAPFQSSSVCEKAL